MTEFRRKSEEKIEHVAVKATRFIGSTLSLVVHTILFLGSFFLYFLGFDFEKILLVVTTIVSLEAIYLSIFIQMSVNRQAAHLEEVAEDVGEIQEDVEEIQEDVDEIQKDVDEIQEDVEDIQEDEDPKEKENDQMLSRIENTLSKVIEQIEELKRTNKKD